VELFVVAALSTQEAGSNALQSAARYSR